MPISYTQLSMWTIYAILVSFAVTAAANQQCYDGPLTVKDPKGDDVEVPKTFIVNQGIALFFDGAGKAIAKNDDFKDFMQSRGQCQVNGCIDKMVSVAVSTVYGKCGAKFLEDECQALAVESLTGAFMACFPGAPRDQVHTTVGNILANFGKDPPKDNSALFAKNKKCPNKATDFPMDGFMYAFGDALKKVEEKHPDAMEFIEKVALDCQQSCLKTTVPLAAATLFQTRNEDKKQIIQAITGAARACFPGQKREDVKILMTAIVAAIDKQAGAPEKLYNANMQVEATSWMSLPMLGGAAVLSMVIFLTGVAVGKRMSSSPTGCSDETELE